MKHKVRVYIVDDKEYFEWQTEELYSKRESTFADSLIDFLYLDFISMSSSFNALGKAIENLYKEKDSRYAGEVLRFLHKMAELHPYFECTYLNWKERFEAAEKKEFQGISDLLPRKQLTHISSDAIEMQRQIREIFDLILNGNLKEGNVNERLTAYFKRYENDSLRTYHFRKIVTDYEIIEGKTFAEVLYPESFYDVIEFILRECIKREQPVRKCKNCQKYFIVRGRTDIEYCSRPIDDAGRTCRDLGAFHVWEKKKQNDEVFKAYRKEYKRRFAWIKTKKIDADDFYAWSEQARKMKAQCDRGEISFSEFTEWLKHI